MFTMAGMSFPPPVDWDRVTYEKYTYGESVDDDVAAEARLSVVANRPFVMSSRVKNPKPLPMLKLTSLMRRTWPMDGADSSSWENWYRCWLYVALPKR